MILPLSALLISLGGHGAVVEPASHVHTRKYPSLTSCGPARLSCALALRGGWGKRREHPKQVGSKRAVGQESVAEPDDANNGGRRQILRVLDVALQFIGFNGLVLYFVGSKALTAAERDAGKAIEEIISSISRTSNPLQSIVASIAIIPLAVALGVVFFSTHFIANALVGYALGGAFFCRSTAPDCG
mmetsp:Transcript_1492/g.2823  ORF Transcript_1492/g.2823 Transcript_1492/m.2823 type:complete len:187 (-) Transcript_1492:340-900(-)